ncbi:MAG: efflux RND transporter permease subunit, partial [Lachnospiraceae bacterium]|nr:efflux RND transporter permease subunit [Lachnospiraceae bacterium]
MNVTKLAIRRPVSTVLIILALAVFGIGSLFGFKLELTPDMELPMLLVITTYPGADRESVEELVTEEIEGAGATLSGVETYTSRVSDSYTVTMFSYEYGVDIDDAYLDLRAALDTLSASLPEDAADPYIMELSMNATDTMTLSATAVGDVDLLAYVNDTIVPELETLLGVADVNVYGGEENYIRVKLKEEKLTQYGLTMSTFAQYLAAVDFQIPGGNVSQGSQNVSVTSSAQAETVAQLMRVPIATATGSLVTLEDVAEVSMSQKRADSISRYDGNENISIGIQKKQSAGAVNVASDVKKAIKRIQQKSDAVDLQIVYDSSDMIVSSLMSVGKTLALGIVLSMVVLFLFFGDVKASLIVGSSMPISLFVTLIVMNAAGFSLNIVTMGALVIAIGMMVDSSIVVIESCFRLKEKHTDYKVAAVEGARIVAGSIIASTITTIVVYLPLSVMKGLSGQLFSELGFTIIFAMLASLVSALTLVPLFYSRFKPQEKKTLPINRVLEKINTGYEKLLRRILYHKIAAVVIAFLLLALSFVMVAFTNVELMPSVDEGTVAVTATFRAGSRLDYIDEMIKPIEDMVRDDENVQNYAVTIDNNVATVTGYLKEERELRTYQIVELWSEKLSDVTNMDIQVASTGTNMMTGFGSGIEVDISGRDLATLKAFSREVEDVMATTEGIIKVSSDLSTATTRAEVMIDPLKAMNVGLAPAQVAMNINNALSGIKACTIKTGGQEYNVMLEFPEGSYDDLNSLMNLTMTTPYKTNVALSQIATIEYTDSPQTLMRVDGIYQVAINASATQDKRFDAQKQIDERVDALTFPEGVSRSESMMDEMIGEEFTAIIRAILIAVFLVFLVMAMQFESPKFSAIVMLSVPFSLIGSFSLLFVTGSTLSMVSLMGLLMLVGGALLALRRR